MNIEVNGKKKEFDKDSLSVSDILKLEEVEKPDMVSVQLNGEFVKKENLSDKYLKDSDKIDFLYFMGGG